MAMKEQQRSVYRSMNGKEVDMNKLININELTPAVGNMRVNARGDELGPGGQIIKKREDVVSEHYATAGSAAHSSGRSTSPVADVVAPVVAPVVAAAKKTTTRTKKEEVVIDAPLTAAEQEMLDEADDWVEDADGNFVQKES